MERGREETQPNVGTGEAKGCAISGSGPGHTPACRAGELGQGGPDPTDSVPAHLSPAELTQKTNYDAFPCWYSFRDSDQSQDVHSVFIPARFQRSLSSTISRENAKPFSADRTASASRTVLASHAHQKPGARPWTPLANLFCPANHHLLTRSGLSGNHLPDASVT